MIMRRVYLDNAASTPMDPEVLASVRSAMEYCYGNASSLHTEGARAKEMLEQSRRSLASFLRCSPEEVFFTSGGTESNNWAIKGFAFANQDKGNHIIVSSVEHECILNACRWLATHGFQITYLPVDHAGHVDPSILLKLIRNETILVSVMHVNNEIGTIQPLSEIGKITREKGIAFHTDACQSFGKIPVNPSESSLEMISVNAHKIYGPKGVGALYVRKGTRLEPLLHGGGQEKGYRSGTENIPGIVGFVKAAEICMENMEKERVRTSLMREILINRLSEQFDNVYFSRDPEHCVPGIINFAIGGQEGEAIRLLFLLDEAGISVSTGSACSNNHGEHSGSHVLRAIGLNPVEARGAIRVSPGRFTSSDDIDYFCDIISHSIQKLNPIFSF